VLTEGTGVNWIGQWVSIDLGAATTFSTGGISALSRLANWVMVVEG